MRPHSSIFPSLAASSLVLGGCTGTVSASSEAADAETATATNAIVVIERTTDASQGSSAEASARFVRVTAPSSGDEALHAIGAALDLPPRGACAAIASLGGMGNAMAPGVRAPVVELVDVGAVTLEADGVAIRLLQRQLPDVTDVVSGVVYARAAGPALLPAATNYVVHVAGGHDLGAFDVAAAAPGDPDGVRIGGETARGLHIAESATVDLSWTPDATDDFVYVDVRPNGVRCVFDEAGRGTVSTLFFDDAGTLVVHRVRRERFHARGIDSGEVRFDFARSLAYVRL